MNLLQKVLEPHMRRIIQNRWEYTDEELKKAKDLGFFDVLDLKAIRYWIKADPVCSVHCSTSHNERRPLYFNPMGMLIRHNCPSGICVHGLSQLSPVNPHLSRKAENAGASPPAPRARDSGFS